MAASLTGCRDTTVQKERGVGGTGQGGPEAQCQPHESCSEWWRPGSHPAKIWCHCCGSEKIVPGKIETESWNRGCWGCGGAPRVDSGVETANKSNKSHMKGIYRRTLDPENNGVSATRWSTIMANTKESHIENVTKVLLFYPKQRASNKSYAVTPSAELIFQAAKTI